ncbi:hypothetical protein COW64_21640 [bacterium (Candidatus Blackallbacteria) CG18_big_fil_WC_8_21_14_2_50_49_26]|nr:MAG: hypothetical protein COW64_21640 [bacterium (Candidatus Blackallbacteria) CG18_big_fil_WC_8_21_14_2_50_49_26]
MNKIFVLTILTLLSLSFSHSVLAAELPAKYTNEIGMTFVLIPPGIYQMRSYHRGDTPSASWHWVRFNKPFYLQTTEVTQQQWEKVMFQAGVDTLNETQNKLVNRYTSFYNNDYESTYIEFEPVNLGPNYPIHYMLPRYNETFFKRLNTGPLIYRLPTEAEWEYAALAGHRQAPSISDLKHYANCWADYADAKIKDYLQNGRYWPRSESDHFDKLATVGSLQPNAWGLYDMIGNVSELVIAYKSTYEEPNGEKYLIDDPVPYPQDKLAKGGSFWSKPANCNPFIAESFDYIDNAETTGFRVWLDAESVRSTLAN